MILQKIKFVLVGVCILFVTNSLAFKEGDKVILSTINIQKDKIDCYFNRKNYVFEDTDRNFRSKKKTNWKIVLKNNKGVILDTTFLNFITEEAAPLNARTEKSIKSHESSNLQKKIEVVRHTYPYKWASIVFKDIKEAYKVELYYKGKLKHRVLLEQVVIY